MFLSSFEIALQQIRVPYRVVGLVVGPKGQTIKQIQQKTQTYIVTPSRERDPVFEITGLPDSVEQARIEISNYIAARTGTFIDSEKKAIAPAVSSASTWMPPDRCLNYPPKEPVMPEEINEFLEEIFSGQNRSPSVKNDSRKRNSVDVLSSDSVHNPNGMNEQYAMWNHGFSGNLKSVLPITNSSPASEILQASGDPSSSGSSSTYSSFSFEASQLVRSSSFPVSSSETMNGVVDVLARKSSDTQVPSTQLAHQNVTLSHHWVPPALTDNGDAQFMPAPTISMGPNSLLGTSVPGINVINAEGSFSAAQTKLEDSSDLTGVKNCIICDSNRISAALVPCGHNLFCYDCVSSLVQSSNAFCPVCHQPADHALRILQ